MWEGEWLGLCDLIGIIWTNLGFVVSCEWDIRWGEKDRKRKRTPLSEWLNELSSLVVKSKW